MPEFWKKEWKYTQDLLNLGLKLAKVISAAFYWPMQVTSPAHVTAKADYNFQSEQSGYEEANNWG